MQVEFAIVIDVHDRATYSLSQITIKLDAAQSRARNDAHYAELLLRFLTSTSRSKIELTSGTMVSDLAELIIDPTNQWQLESVRL